jgi:hypothetical protein
MVYLIQKPVSAIQKTCVGRRASTSDTGMFSYNYSVSNLPQKDLRILVIFLDSAGRVSNEVTKFTRLMILILSLYR